MADNYIHTDYKERKTIIDTLTEAHYGKLDQAVCNFQNALHDHQNQNSNEILKVLLNEVISQAFSYFENNAKKEILAYSEILLKHTNKEE